MAVNSSDVTAQMREALALSEPDLDTSIGSTTRKILDVVGEVVAEAYVDRYLMDYQYDIDTKSGADLDDFVALFGFSRLPARRASGSLTFERSAASEVESLIPRGTRASTDDANEVVVATLVPALMMRNDLTIVIPAQAVIGGTAGNIGANYISRLLTPADGVGSVGNAVSFTGGSEAESDEQLRERFKRTIFRNLAGTEQMFRGAALEDEDVSQVNVIGASMIHREQVEIISGHATVTGITSRYMYPDTITMGLDIDGGDIFIEGIHYSFDPSTLTISVLNGLIEDALVEVEFEYVPMSSRNDPDRGVTNCVDVYVKGSRPTAAQEVAVFRNNRRFNTDPDSPLFTENFARVGSELPPAANSHIISLSLAPMMQVADNGVLTIQDVTYVEGIDYWPVNDISQNGGSLRSLSGIEFAEGALDNLNDLMTFPVSYTYNAVPGEVETSIRSWRLITTDVRAHAAMVMRIRVNLVVILESGTSSGTAKAQIEGSLTQFFDEIDFAGVVQVSDVLSVVSRVSGVDAVRMATSADDYFNFAMQRVNIEGTVLESFATPLTQGTRRATDIPLDHNQVPVFDSITLTVRAQNSFGAV